MPGREQERSELKKRLLAELDRARLDLGVHARRASDQLSPTAIVERSVRKHRVAWIAGATVAGVLVLRLLMPSSSVKNERDKSAKSGTKGTLFRLLSDSLITMGRKAAVNYATRFFQNQFKQPFQASAHEDGAP